VYDLIIFCVAFHKTSKPALSLISMKLCFDLHHLFDAALIDGVHLHLALYVDTYFELLATIDGN